MSEAIAIVRKRTIGDLEEKVKNLESSLCAAIKLIPCHCELESAMGNRGKCSGCKFKDHIIDISNHRTDKK